MRRSIVIFSICLLAGCVGSPPKPPAVKGEYRPINKVEVKELAARKPVSQRIFNFQYEGDIVSSLYALRDLQPQINVSPPLGTPRQLPVRINLRGTTLENALRTIGEQGGDVAEVVWNTTASQSGNQVFIRFRSIEKQHGAMPLVGTN